MADKYTLTGIFGGTFDPIHNGHLLPLRQAAEQVGIQKVGLMPCHIPPHKGTPSVSSHQRLKMVELACETDPLFYADDFELLRETPSYSVETLKQKKQQKPEQTLCFFMGMDSLRSLNSWYHWQDLLSYCHIIVCKRPGMVGDFNPQVTELLNRCQAKELGGPTTIYDTVVFTWLIPMSWTFLRHK